MSKLNSSDEEQLLKEHMNSAQSFYESGEFLLAFEEYRKAASLKYIQNYFSGLPPHLRPLEALYCLLPYDPKISYKSELFDIALDYYSKHETEYGFIHYCRARIFILREEYQQALEQFEQARYSNPPAELEILYNYLTCFSYGMMNDWESSCRFFKKAKQNDKWLNIDLLAKVYVKKGDASEKIARAFVKKIEKMGWLNSEEEV